METLDWAEIYAWIFVGLGVWSVMMGAMIAHCWMEDVSEAEVYEIKRKFK